MPKMLIGKKVAMSQIFTEDGKLIPVTVIEAGPCVVSQIKTAANDGYEAVQLGFCALKKAPSRRLAICQKRYHSAALLERDARG